MQWNIVSGAAYYNLLKNNSETIKVNGGSASSYVDESLGVSETHNYKIRACDSSGNCSAYSSGIDAQSPAMCKNLPAATCPTSGWKAPENFMATKGNCGEIGRIFLTWNDVSDEDYYEIYRATSFMFDGVVTVASPGANTTSYNDGGTVKNAGQRYYYAIRACKSGGICSNYNYYDAEAPEHPCNFENGNKFLRVSVVGSGGGTIKNNHSTEWFNKTSYGTVTGDNTCDKNDKGMSNACSYEYPYDDAYGETSRITIIKGWTITPFAGSSWGGWLYGSCAGGTNCAMNQDHVAVGIFNSGSYSKIPVCEPGVNGACGSAAGGSYENPPTTNLCSAGSASAVADGGTTWNWTCNGSGGGTNASCDAVKINKAVLLVTKSGSGSGVVTSNPSGINCGSDCSESFDEDSNVKVTLTANADTGSGFGGWTGVSCEEKNNNQKTCTITMKNADITVNASFLKGFAIVSSDNIIFATIVEGLSADSSETTIVFSGISDGNINLNAVLPSAIDKTKAVAEFSEDGGYTWKSSGNINFQLTGSQDIKFRVRNIPGSTTSGTYPINIEAKDNGGNVQTTTVNLQVEKITTEWQEI